VALEKEQNNLLSLQGPISGEIPCWWWCVMKDDEFDYDFNYFCEHLCLEKAYLKNKQRLDLSIFSQKSY